MRPCTCALRKYIAIEKRHTLILTVSCGEILPYYTVSSGKKYHLNHITIGEMSYTSDTIFENIGVESFEKHFGS